MHGCLKKGHIASMPADECTSAGSVRVEAMVAAQCVTAMHETSLQSKTAVAAATSKSERIPGLGWRARRPRVR